MKSRIAVVAMVGLGMLFSTAGTGLAVSGIASSSDNASVAQYGTPGGTPTPDGGVAGDHDQSGGTNGGGDENGAGNGGNGPDGGVLPAEDTAPDSTTADTTQSARQVEATTSSSQLPFTGFAAIPVMLGGIALLSGGLVLRRRTRAE